jgi:YihY family inner membrane protein
VPESSSRRAQSVRVLRDTLREFITINGPFLSAGLSFYALLHCFPLLLLFITVLGYVLERSDLAMEATQGFVQTLFPASERSVADAVERFAEHRNVLSLVTFGAFLLFGSFLFGAARHVLNVVFGVDRRRTFVKGLRADLLAMLGTGGLLAIAVGLAASLALVFDVVSRMLWLRPWLDPGWPLVGRALAFLFAVALFYLLFQVAPAESLGRRSLLAASLAGAVLHEVSKSLFVWYVREAGDFAMFYGAPGDSSSSSFGSTTLAWSSCWPRPSAGFWSAAVRMGSRAGDGGSPRSLRPKRLDAPIAGAIFAVEVGDFDSS